MLALAFYDVLCCLICHFCALHSMRKLPISQAFGASIASDYISCSSSFCTFSLSTRHCSRWISCICQHLKIVWETSKTDPFSLGKIIRHTFALALAPKVKKCDHFGGSSIPSSPWIHGTIRHFCALHSMRKLSKSQAFCASIASDSTSCSSSFCTFSLFTRHSR